MAGNNVQFVKDLKSFETKSNDTVNEVRKLLAYDLFSRIIDRTPIYFSHEPHAGTTKFNWKCTINTLSERQLKGRDKKGDNTKKRMLNVLSRVSGDDTIFFSNSVPWIFKIEDGGYPNPVKYGSYNTRTGKYEIRTAGGYSKQAPAGMVKLSIAEFPYLRDKAIRSVVK